MYFEVKFSILGLKSEVESLYAGRNLLECWDCQLFPNQGENEPIPRISSFEETFLQTWMDLNTYQEEKEKMFHRRNFPLNFCELS